MARILVVEDSLMSRTNLIEILASQKHEIAGEACNGEEAFNLYEELKPDLVTMDITMPVMNGIEALKKIMEKYSEAKVIMITALGQAGKVLECLNAGARHYITKPYEAKNILFVIEEVLRDDEIINSHF